MKIMVFIITFVCMLLVAGLCLVFMPKSSQAAPETAGPAFSPEIMGLIKSAYVLSEQSITMPVEIFKRARALADQPDTSESIRAADIIFEMDKSITGFGRRIAMTTIRFLGKRDYDPQSQIYIESMILRALDDQAVWVRYDAAWTAGLLKIKDEAVHARLLKMQAEMATQTVEEGSAEEKLKAKVDAYLSGSSE